MEQHYKSFMDKQHPSDTLLKDTICKAKELSETESSIDIDAQSTETGKPFIREVKMKEHRQLVWRLAFAAVAVFCLMAGGIWSRSTRIVYTDLEDVTVVENSEELQNNENVGDVKNSYLGNVESSYYVFDKNAEISEIETGQGKITVQVGTVLNTGIQALYQTAPEQIKGHKVYLGKYRVDDKELLLAAFVKNDQQYYLEGERVTEKEMTAYVKELLK